MRISKKILFLIYGFFLGLLSVFEFNYVNLNKKTINENESTFKNYVLTTTKEKEKDNFTKQKDKNIEIYKKIKLEEEQRKIREEEERLRKEEEERLRKEEEERLRLQQEIDNFTFDYPVTLDGNIDYSAKKQLKYMMTLLPNELINRFYNAGGKLILTESLYDPSYGVLSGKFVINSNTIYIAGTEKYVTMALLHEFGHFLDSLSNFASLGEEFTNIYYEEKEFITVFSYDNHYKSNQREYFASAFEEMIFDPNGTKSEVPKTYEYIQNYINNILY